MTDTLKQVREALELITQFKTPERVKADIEAMDGRFCPDYEQTITALYKAIQGNAREALSLLDAWDDKKPIVRLDRYYPALPDESEVELYIDESWFSRIRKSGKGWVVPLIAINPRPKEQL